METKLGKQIVVAELGWVFIGEVSIGDVFVNISDAFVIRKWGTTAGLGQIALEGPTKETIFDKCGFVRVFCNKVIAMLECVYDELQ